MVAPWPEHSLVAAQLFPPEKDEDFIEEVARLLEAVPELECFPRGAQLYITTGHLQSVEPSERYAEARRLAEIVKAAVRHHVRRRLDGGGLAELRPDGSVALFAQAHGGATSSGWARASVGGQPRPELHLLISKALDSRQLEWLLGFDPERQDSWTELYKVFEAIKADAGELIYKRVEKKELKRFTRTANSPDVLGREARHGQLGKEVPPKNPMTHADAKRLITMLFRWWLDQRSLPASSEPE